MPDVTTLVLLQLVESVQVTSSLDFGVVEAFKDFRL